MNPPDSRFNSNGFTLLELLLSLTITAVILVIIFGTFRVGVRAWEKGEQDVARQQRLRSVLQLLYKQVASATPSARLILKERRFSFSGDQRTVRLISKLSLDPAHARGDVFCQYTITADETGLSLDIIEEPLATAALPLQVDSFEGAEGYTLLSGMHALDITYLSQAAPNGNHTWLPQWESLDWHRLPLAVKIEVVATPADDPIVVVIPLRGRATG